MMIFQDQIPGGVGPVRSARQYFVEWAGEWRATYVHHGGSPQALETLYAKGRGQWVWNADGFRWLGRYLWRTTDPSRRCGPFGSDLKRELRPFGGTINVFYPYETITYRYDAATNRYVRYINKSTKPQIDGGDGEIVAPANVVILRMAFGPLNDGHPDKHRLEARDVGVGEAWISTNGVTIKGSWSKKSPTAPTLLFGPDGEAVTLTAGQTFVQVLPLTDSFKFTAGLWSVWQPPMQALGAEPL